MKVMEKNSKPDSADKGVQAKDKKEVMGSAAHAVEGPKKAAIAGPAVATPTTPPETPKKA
jgi:hypothetical protein